MSNPLVSVVIPVYNRPEYVRDALDSVMAQSYTKIEILCVDDCSTDQTPSILHYYSLKDPRIRLMKTAVNSRQAVARNIAMDQARGKYIANLDSDDIATPQRIEKQVHYMETHTDVSVLGGVATHFGESASIWLNSNDDDQLKVHLMSGNIIVTSTAMYRAEFLNQHGLRFDPEYLGAEDYELLTRIALRGGKFANLAEVLVQYRVHADSDSATIPLVQKEKANQTRRNLFYGLSPKLTESEVEVMCRLANEWRPGTEDEMHMLLSAIEKLVVANNEHQLMPKRAFHRRLGGLLAESITNSCRGRVAWKAYLRSPLKRERAMIRLAAQMLFHRHQ